MIVEEFLGEAGLLLTGVGAMMLLFMLTSSYAHLEAWWFRRRARKAWWAAQSKNAKRP